MQSLVKKSVLGLELVKDFEKFVDVTPSTMKSYKTGIRAFLRYVAENGVKSPTTETVLEFKRSMQNLGRKASTINLYLSATKRFFSWTAKSGLYVDIAKDVKGVRTDSGFKKDFFLGSQLKEILGGFDRSSLEGMRNYAIFALMSTCGLRTCEISRAKISDLSTLAGQPVLYIHGKGKSDSKDFVKLSKPVESALRSYLKMRDKVDKTQALFASCSDRNFGQSISRVTVSTMCKKAMVKAGYDSDRLTAHSLRHSAITLCLMGGESLQNVQAFARHSSMNTTLIYSHNVDRINSQCENLISKEIFN
ncbi:MAG: tyrosine-type recombinase/integrase [Synergistaceae bacterium]|nr:tyrosine-type recombinase/integrase [Synergistaceae bacterium]MBQ6434790.1 tyrosine-type recombinase/integrase [Synergistaceae bacterium]MBR0076252.1 tyrosine-type recombinase/integrase [Synergistaceae bacterium]